MFGNEYFAQDYPAEGIGSYGLSGRSVCASVSPPTRGILGVIFTITTSTGIGQLAFEAYNSPCVFDPGILSKPLAISKGRRVAANRGAATRVVPSSTPTITAVSQVVAPHPNQRSISMSRLSPPTVIGPPLPSGSPVLQLFMSGVPAGATLVVDSAKHTMTLTLADGTVQDATPFVLLTSQGLQWIEVADCDSIHCVCVRASAPIGNATATVKIETQLREG